MRYLKVFIASAAIWGGGMYGFMTGDIADVASLDYGSRTQVLTIMLPTTLLFSLFVTGLLFFFDRRRLAAGYDISNDKLRPDRAVVVPRPVNETTLAVKEIFRTFEGAKTRVESDIRLEIRTGMSWKSFGEVITVDLEAVEENQTLVNLHSRPWYPATYVDYGINSDNLARIESQLESLGKDIRNKSMETQ